MCVRACARVACRSRGGRAGHGVVVVISVGVDCLFDVVLLQACYDAYAKGGFSNDFGDWNGLCHAMKVNLETREEFAEVKAVLAKEIDPVINPQQVHLVSRTGVAVTSEYYLLKSDALDNVMRGVSLKDAELSLQSIPGEDGQEGQRGVLCRLSDDAVCPKVAHQSTQGVVLKSQNEHYHLHLQQPNSEVTSIARPHSLPQSPGGCVVACVCVSVLCWVGGGWGTHS